MDDIRLLAPEEFPPLLREINDPPEKLYYRGHLPDWEDFKILAVVGARKNTDYGKEACRKIISELRGQPVIIVSGLALGIDSIAHRAALDAGLITIAVPGSGLLDEAVYPASHLHFAHEILRSGGLLLSEFEPDFRATPWAFPQRNRIMAGLSHATLVVEAEARSGTLITSRLATEYNRDVLTIPGSIFSKNSEGPNLLLGLGAAPITSGKDVLRALHFSLDTPESAVLDATDAEKRVLELLTEPLEKDELLTLLEMEVSEANILLSAMEIKGLIAESLGKIRKNF